MLIILLNLLWEILEIHSFNVKRNIRICIIDSNNLFVRNSCKFYYNRLNVKNRSTFLLRNKDILLKTIWMFWWLMRSFKPLNHEMNDCVYRTRKTRCLIKRFGLKLDTLLLIFVANLNGNVWEHEILSKLNVLQLFRI